jgi:phosphoglycolate phosphatase
MQIIPKPAARDALTSTLPILKDLGIFDEFGIVISGDTLAKKKPDPLPLLHAAKFFGVNPKDAIWI